MADAHIGAKQQTRCPTRRRFLHCLAEVIAPSRQPEYCITHFTESEGRGFVVECRGLHWDVSQEADGTWYLSFHIWKTTTYPWGRVVTKRKVPSAVLREQVARIVGIETTLDGLCPYPSLVGKARRQPDPNELLRRMQKLMTSNEVKSLYTEPNDGEGERNGVSP